MAEKSYDGDIVREVLRKSRTELRQRLPIETLPSSLASERIISEEEFQSVTVSGISSVQQTEKLVDILATKDGSAILKALEILNTRECGYQQLVGSLFTAMDDLQKKRCIKPAFDIHHAAVKAIEYPVEGGNGVSHQPSQRDQVQEMKRKRSRSSTSSGDPTYHSFEKKRLDEYLKMKMDLEEQDVKSMHPYKCNPTKAIRLLYANALKRITTLLEPHLLAVKDAADTYLRLNLHEEARSSGVTASDIEAAESISKLLIHMSVKESWDSTCFLEQAVDAIPAKAIEREVAVAILSHYSLHLSIYETATLLKDDLAKRKKSESEDEGKEVVASNKLVPLEITSPKSIGTFTCQDCHHLQVALLSSNYHIPKDKIICHNVEESQSTTVTFIIPSQFVSTVMKHSAQLPTVWVLLELHVIEVAIPGVFSFRPTAKCLLMLLQESKIFTTNLLRITEVLPYQMHSLLDWDAKEPLTGYSLRHKMVERRPEYEESVYSTADSGVKPAPEQSNDTIIPSEGNDEMQTSLHEMQETVKDLEQKVADLFMHNVSLKTKLTASREVEKEHKQSITNLEERLVQALEAQEAATQKLSQMVDRESHLEDKVTQTDLETEVETLEQMKMQEEIHLSYLAKSYDAAILREGTHEMKSRLLELEECVKDLEETIACYFLDYMALYEELNPSWDVVQEQRQSVISLTEQLASEVDNPKLLLNSWESFLEDKIKTLETRKAGLEHKFEKLILKQMVQKEALLDAAEHGDVDKMKLLLKRGYAVNVRDKWGFTLVLQAAFQGHTNVVDLLVEQYGCSLTDVTDVGRNALLLAAAGGHVSTIRYLAPKMQSLLHSTDNHRCTMLHYAAEEGHVEVVRFVADEYKLDPNSRDKWGMTPVLRAARHGHTDIVDILFTSYGSSLTDVDNDGNNALHLAARMDHPETVKYLLPILRDRRLDKNRYGWTCLDLAQQRGHQEVIGILDNEEEPA